MISAQDIIKQASAEVGLDGEHSTSALAELLVRLNALFEAWRIP